MIEMRRAQRSFGDGLIAEEVSDLREDWMRHADQVLAELAAAWKRMAPWVADVSLFLSRARAEKRPIMFEGAQGTLLDLDHGTYPFVTSSNPVAGGALTGSGLGPKEVDRVIGVAKAYVTRVGGGPFPSEDTGPAGEQMSAKGHEFGTTTGRPRRCGWFDAVLLRYAARINGLTELFVTKLDVLSGLPELRICVAYEFEGRRFEDFPPHQTIFHKARPVYEEAEGWPEEITEVERFEQLPAAARKYLGRMAELSGVPIRNVSVGPDRKQTLAVDPA